MISANDFYSGVNFIPDDETPDERELNELIDRREQLIKQVAERTENGKLAPDSQAMLLSMEYDKVTDEINAIRLSRSFRSTADGQKQAAMSTVIGDMCRALYKGAGSLTEREKRDFTLSGSTATILNPSSIQDFFALLRATNPLARLGARIMNATGNYTQFPYESSGAIVQWLQENGSVTADTTAAIAARKIDFKHAALKLKAHNFWLQDSDMGGVGMGSAIISTMAINAMNEAIIKVCLSGASGSYQPVGLDNLTGAGGVQTVDAGGAVLTDYDKFVNAVTKLLRVNVPLDRIGGIISPEVWGQFNKLKDQQDQPMMMPEGLKGIPMYTTSAALETYSTNTRTRAYLGHWPDCIVGMGGGPLMRMSQDVHADDFVTAFYCWMRIDIQFVRRSSFCIVTDILNA